MNNLNGTFSKLWVALLLCLVSLNVFGQHKIKTIGNKPIPHLAKPTAKAVKFEKAKRR